MNDFWYHLYQLLRKMKELKNGPTVLFLIGAYRLKFEKPEFGFEDLFSVLSNGPINTRIEYCSTIEAYVLTTNSYPNQDSDKVPDFGSYHVSYGGGLSSKKNAVSTLTEEYSAELVDAKFTRIHNGKEWVWEKFTEDDVLMIKQI